MSDIAIIFDPSDESFDFRVEAGDLAMDDTMETAILISLCCDARATDSDELPDGSDDKRGWWGDFHARIDGDAIGGRRWLLVRKKITAEAIRLLADYDRAALQWLVDDGVASAVQVTTARYDTYTVAETIAVHHPDGNHVTFNYVWSFLDAH